MPISVTGPFVSQFALYEALRRGTPAAYNYLYAELHDSFQFWVLNNNGSDMDAEDAFQKGLLNFLLNLQNGKYTFHEGTKVTTVVFEYCKKVWLTELQSARKRLGVALPENLEVADIGDIQADLERLVIVETVRKSLGLLKEECRQLLEWFFVDELSLREIAQRLGLKETSAKSKRYDCTEKLKTIYRQTTRQNNL